MSVAKMNKMTLVGFKKDKKRFLKLLQEMGLVELAEIKIEKLKKEYATDELYEVDNFLSDCKSAIAVIEKYTKSRKSGFEKPKMSTEEISKILENKQILREHMKKVVALEDEINQIKNDRGKLESTIDILKPWINLDTPIGELKSIKDINFNLGVISKRVYEKFENEINFKIKEHYIELLNETKPDVYLLLIYHKSFANEIEDVIRKYGFVKYELPINDTPKVAIDNFERDISNMEVEILNTKNEILENGKYLDSFKALCDYYTTKRDRIVAGDKILNSKKTFYLEGWLPEKAVDNVNKALKKLNTTYYIDFRKPEDGEEFPIILENNKFVRPFEAVTEFYSLPKSNEIDPDFIMAPFFFVFYGMMIGDAGYGIVLALLTFLALKFIPFEGMAKKLIQLLMLGGISTLIWGAMFGSWFGNLIKLKPLWFDPLKDPMKLLIFSFILGVIQVYVAMAMKAYINIKEGKILDAIFDQGFWYIFLTGLMMFLIPQLSSIAKYVALTGAILLILTQGRAKKNIIMKFLSGLISLYSVTSFLGDVLSYSRILALGLATTVVATVMNTIALLFKGNIFLYIIFAPIVLIIGHSFNIAINALGAFVHSSRLQYIEFFGKFYEGGGKAFTPFRIKTKYFKFVKEE